MTDIDYQLVMAKLAYAAYGQTTDFKNYQGNPMPNWDDLGDTIQGAWVAAAKAVSDYLMGPDAADEMKRPGTNETGYLLDRLSVGDNEPSS